jgi:gluconate 5-dehydrogenase
VTAPAGAVWTNHVARHGLAGRVGLVTGAAQGIGLAIARGLAAAQAEVVLVDRDAAVAERCEELRSAGFGARAIVCDVTDPEGVDRVFAATPGRLDILVNNAAILITGSALEVRRADWQRVIDTNLTACFFIAQAAARLMAAQGGGRIINMSSIVGRTARAKLSAYIVAKAGIDGMTRALACELAGRNITVNAIAPGFVTTDMSRVDASGFEQAVVAMVPARRWGRPEDVAGVAVFLASEAAAYVNGQTIYVDGGFTAASR